MYISLKSEILCDEQMKPLKDVQIRIEEFYPHLEVDGQKLCGSLGEPMTQYKAEAKGSSVRTFLKLQGIDFIITEPDRKVQSLEEYTQNLDEYINKLKTQKIDPIYDVNDLYRRYKYCMLFGVQVYGFAWLSYNRPRIVIHEPIEAPQQLMDANIGLLEYYLTINNTLGRHLELPQFILLTYYRQLKEEKFKDKETLTIVDELIDLPFREFVKFCSERVEEQKINTDIVKSISEGEYINPFEKEFRDVEGEYDRTDRFILLTQNYIQTYIKSNLSVNELDNKILYEAQTNENIERHIIETIINVDNSGVNFYNYTPTISAYNNSSNKKDSMIKIY